jgi:hypothetical protein
MKRRRRSSDNVIWILVFVLSAVSVSYGVIDKMPAPFRTELPGDVEGKEMLLTTFQSWDFSISEDLAADTDDTYTTYGIAEATVTSNDIHYNTHNFFQGVWELNGTMDVLVPNNLEQNSLKDVWLQITYLDLADEAPSISVTPDGGIAVDLTLVGDPFPLFNDWYHAAYKVTLESHPIAETFHIASSDDGPLYIDGMIIETQCVPEPASLLIMSLGVLIARGKLRKKEVL